jgi:hypothetical protein
MDDHPVNDSLSSATRPRMSLLALLSAVLVIPAFLFLFNAATTDGYEDRLGILPWLWLPGLAAIVLAVVALRRVPRRRRALTLTRHNWPAIIGLVFGLLTLPAPFLDVRSHVAEDGMTCRSNLKQIAIAIGMYQDENDGVFPPSIAMLVDGKHILSTWLLYCPASLPKRVYGGNPAPDPATLETSFVYARPLKRGDAPMPVLPIMWERKHWHRGAGINVVYSDLHVEAVEPARLKGEIDGHAAWYTTRPAMPE